MPAALKDPHARVERADGFLVGLRRQLELSETTELA